jgi:hypothetical protein
MFDAPAAARIARPVDPSLRSAFRKAARIRGTENSTTLALYQVSYLARYVEPLVTGSEAEGE